jgi:hypothetical protein
MAGYTTALTGIAAVNNPNGLLIASLNCTAEVTLGILCSGAGMVFTAGLRRRDGDFKAFAAKVLEHNVGRGAAANAR